jgi:hypothetical protein
VGDILCRPRFDLTSKVRPFSPRRYVGVPQGQTFWGFVAGNFPGADIHATVNLSAVGRDNLTIELFRYFNSNIGLSRRSRAENNDDFFDNKRVETPGVLNQDKK